MAENYQKKELLALMNTGNNKLCVDCNAPSPQWASVSYGTFICLECSGIHRGFGVHISFVRSITMDKWSEDQLKKMKLGGNEAFKTFMENYGAGGGYSKGIGMQEKYNSWAASQYREKLAAACADPPQAWSPSPAPPTSAAPSRPSSAQATRKSRAGGGLGGGGGIGSSNLNQSSIPPSQKDQNEAYFERMGNSNALRPDNLPPSQGGRYQGFGSTPSPDPTSGSNSGYAQHPSYSLSSHSAPTFDELQRNPLGALSKGWGLFSSAVSSAASEINQSVVKPGMARASEYAQGEQGEEWKRYLSTAGAQAREVGGWASAKAGEGWGQLNEVTKSRGGVDLNEQLGKLGLGAQGQGQGVRPIGGQGGYGQLERSGDAEDGFITPHNGGQEEDFFDAWDNHGHGQSSSASAKPAAKATGGKKDGWEDDEWKDF
ncbi:uncharacterized protein I303_108562 [Kwoniella dejecticola CBS 10117]|uniref:ADP-ribosylation factor GTPase-activating protein 1 n=1 Tax=Kwoniella dejecticola CBS 10117 TaxID=1296121 RepID=A0A1A5ZX18_9TREE|nr:ADP-ribosylation factor GTPase-activating protein 1 [Kwoniella dejecticola CBS 10117]OBR82353.1 ADP-ribosylation factor GTPase-activating protein 1 [Kwoniella dejecticola CBS 10117]